MTPQITIVGLGLIGTSVALALKNQDKEFLIVGHDRDHDAVARASKKGALDKSHWNLISACEDADFIVLAIPTSGIAPTLEALREDLKPGCVIVDTAPIKTPVLADAERLLPAGNYFVGGNPLLARSGLEVEDASADLFRESSWALCPTAGTAPDALKVAADFVTALGAQPLFLDPTEHDGLMAAVDGMPSVLSAALVNVVGGNPAWRELRRLAGNQFDRAGYLPDFEAKDLSAGVMANNEYIATWIDNLIEELKAWQQDLRGEDGEAVKERFASAIERRQNWLKLRARGEWEEREEEPIASGGFLGRLFGMAPRRRGD